MLCLFLKKNVMLKLIHILGNKFWNYITLQNVAKSPPIGNGKKWQNSRIFDTIFDEMCILDEQNMAFLKEKSSEA